jgi:inward rectifier potassium channel
MAPKSSRAPGRSAPTAAAQARGIAANFLRIRSKGARISFHDDFYPFLLKLTWPRFFGLFALTFVALNAIFAGLYLLRPGCVTGADSYLDYFFFSIETFATIGYGEMTPTGTWAHIVMSLEALSGICATALMTGLIFARFTRPTSQILFSDRMIIAPWNGVPHLMFRMANQRQNQLVEAQLSLMVLLKEQTIEGATIRRPTDLTLVRSRNAMFALTWLAMHRIDESSPFYGENAMAKLAEQAAEVFVTITGFDETLMQTVHARFRYALDHIVPAKRFADVLEVDAEGVRTIDYDKFHEIVEENAS